MRLSYIQISQKVCPHIVVQDFTISSKQIEHVN